MIINTEMGFTVIADPDDYLVTYTVIELGGVDEENRQLYAYKGGADTTEDIDQADVFLSGHVKWDGCSNWYFDCQDDLMIHGCSRDDITRIGNILGFCYDMTKELCPNWEGDE